VECAYEISFSLRSIRESLSKITRPSTFHAREPLIALFHLSIYVPVSGRGSCGRIAIILRAVQRSR